MEKGKGLFFVNFEWSLSNWSKNLRLGFLQMKRSGNSHTLDQMCRDVWWLGPRPFNTQNCSISEIYAHLRCFFLIKVLSPAIWENIFLSLRAFNNQLFALHVELLKFHRIVSLLDGIQVWILVYVVTVAQNRMAGHPLRSKILCCTVPCESLPTEW